MLFATPAECAVFDELVYVCDGTPEGMLSAVFAAFERHEDPSAIIREADFQPQLLQTPVRIPTDEAHAARVSAGVKKRLGAYVHRQVIKCTLSGREDAPTALYRFIRFAFDGAGGNDGASQERAGARRDGSRKRCGKSAIDDIAHPCVKPLFEAARAVDNECEKIRQFARFEHLKDDEREIWFARVNPKDAVIPLVMGHFVERFNVQPFILHDEVHGMAGVWDGSKRYLVDADDEMLSLPGPSADEAVMQRAWRTFYRTLSVEARVNPELRRKLMPKRFWKNLTEMREELPALQVSY